MPRKKENRTECLVRLHQDSPAILQEMAATWGCTYNGKGSISKLMDAIAQGKITLVRPLDNPK